MGFRSPFGNGPQSLPSPVPGGMTLAGLQSAASMPQTVVIPKMVGAGFAQPQPAPAPSPGPSPEPIPSPAPSSGGSSSGDLGDYANAGEHLDLGDYATAAPEPGYLSPDHPIFQSKQRFRVYDGKKQLQGRGGGWKDISPDQEKSIVELYNKFDTGIRSFAPDLVHNTGAGVGSLAGDVAGTYLGGGPGGVAGSVLGSMLGGQTAEWIKKLTDIKDPEERSRTMDILVDGTFGLLFAEGPRATANILGKQAARLEAGAATAGGGDIARINAEQLLTDQKLIKSETGANLMLRRDQVNPTNARVASDIRAIAADQGVEGDTLRNHDTMQNAEWWSAVTGLARKLKVPLENTQTRIDDLVGNDKTNFGGQFLKMTENFGSEVGLYKGKAFQAAGNKTFDIEPALAVMRTEIDKLAGGAESLFHKDGSVNQTALKDLTGPREGVGHLLGNYQRLRGINNVPVSPDGFGQAGRLSVETKPVFERSVEPGPAGAKAVGETPVATDVQMPLFSEGRPPTFTPTATSNALPPGSAKAMGDLEMTQTHPGSAPGELGAEVRTDTGIQPSLPGDSTTATVSSSMAPNPAGKGTRGLTLEQIDKELDNSGVFANHKKRRKGESLDFDEQAWFQVDTALRNVFTDAAVQSLEKAGDKTSADWLLATKEAYHENIEDLGKFEKMVRENPTNAARYLVDKQKPATVGKLIGLLRPEQQKYLAGGVLDALGAPSPRTNEPATIGAKAMQNLWDDYDPKVKDLLFDEKTQGLVNALFNTGRAIENAKPNITIKPEDNPLVRRLVRMIHSRGKGMAIRGGAQLIEKIFIDHPQIADQLIATAPEVFVVNPEKAMEAARIRRAVAQRMTSKTGKAVAHGAGQLGRTMMDRELKLRDLGDRNPDQEAADQFGGR